jgi:hypothetical protein
MMSAIEKQVIQAAKAALEVVGDLAKLKSTDPRAAAVLAVIRGLAEAVASGFARKIDPKNLRKTIESARGEIRGVIAANDAAIKDRIDQKFPVGEPPK